MSDENTAAQAEAPPEPRSAPTGKVKAGHAPTGPRKPFRDRYPSRPFVVQTQRFASVSAKKIHDRAYARVDSALYGISMVLRITGTEDGAASVEQVVDEHLAGVARDLAAEQARLRILADEHGVAIQIQYTRPTTIEAQVSSPRSMRFLGMIRDLDTLIGAIDGLWIAGVLDDRQHSQAVYLWQQRLVRLASRLIELAGRAFSAARRQGKIAEDGEIAENAVDTAELDAAEAAVSEVELGVGEGGEIADSDPSATDADSDKTKKPRRKKAATEPGVATGEENADIAING
ncbi:MAG: hypothetical protein ACYDHY_15865 [Acidiferrobacterales bacterium]